MANKTAILAVKIITDAKAGQKGVEEYATGLDKLQGTMGKMAGPAAVALGGISALAVAAGKSASEAQQAAGAVESVYGKHADETKKLASQAATNVGLASSEYSNMAAVLGAQLKNMGVPQEELVGQTDDLIKKGADLAAMFGGTTADAVGALGSLMRGERDPIERYGVSIKAADVQAKMAAMGLTGLTGEAAKTAETQATLALVTEQTAAAHGQFAREADSAAGAQQIANASFEDASAKLGEVLLPIMAQAATAGAEMATWVSENTGVVTALVAIIAGLAAGILIVNGAISAYKAIMVVATAAQWLYNAALSANPIGIVIVAIGLLVAAIVFLISNWEEVGAVVEDIWAGICGWIEEAVGWINDAIGALGDFLGMGGGSSGGGGAGGVDSPPPAPPRGPADSPFSGAGGTGGWPTWAAGVGSSTTPTTAGPIYNTTINGALDVDGTARTLKRVMKTHDARVGSRVAVVLS